MRISIAINAANESGGTQFSWNNVPPLFVRYFQLATS